MTVLRSSGDVSLFACSYLLTHLLLFGRVSLDVLAQGAGVGVALGAAGNLAGVGLLGTGAKGDMSHPSACHSQHGERCRMLTRGAEPELLALFAGSTFALSPLSSQSRHGANRTDSALAHWMWITGLR